MRSSLEPDANSLSRHLPAPRSAAWAARGWLLLRWHCSCSHLELKEGIFVRENSPGESFIPARADAASARSAVVRPKAAGLAKGRGEHLSFWQGLLRVLKDGRLEMPGQEINRGLVQPQLSGCVQQAVFVWCKRACGGGRLLPEGRLLPKAAQQTSPFSCLF